MALKDYLANHTELTAKCRSAANLLQTKAPELFDELPPTVQTRIKYIANNDFDIKVGEYYARCISSIAEEMVEYDIARSLKHYGNEELTVQLFILTVNIITTLAIVLQKMSADTVGKYLPHFTINQSAPGFLGYFGHMNKGDAYSTLGMPSAEFVAGDNATNFVISFDAGGTSASNNDWLRCTLKVSAQSVAAAAVANNMQKLMIEVKFNYMQCYANMQGYTRTDTMSRWCNILNLRDTMENLATALYNGGRVRN